MLTVGLAEWPDRSGRFLEFQIARHRSERADGYCIVDAPVTGLGGHLTVFGGLTACRLRGNQLHLSTNDEARATFGWPPQLLLTIDVDEAALKRLRRTLRKILRYPPPGQTVAVNL